METVVRLNNDLCDACAVARGQSPTSSTDAKQTVISQAINRVMHIYGLGQVACGCRPRRTSELGPSQAWH